MKKTSTNSEPEPWWIFRGEESDADRIQQLPAPPPWRRLEQEARKKRGQVYLAGPREKRLVNAALFLRRPLLVTGDPGIGKSSLAYAVAEELQLGEVLRWPITTRTTLDHGLYQYDAIGRLHDASLARSRRDLKKEEGGEPGEERETEDIGRYIRLGPLGTALFPQSAGEHPPRPRVLLIDEIDKSDIDLPNNLLHLFEEAEFEIPELQRLPEEKEPVQVYVHGEEKRVPLKEHGRVRANVFPFVVLTSNDERSFPPAFLRRCIRLDIQPPDQAELVKIVRRHLETELEAATEDDKKNIERLIKQFVDRRGAHGGGEVLATDQLLNAVYMLFTADPNLPEESELRKALFRSLSEA